METDLLLDKHQRGTLSGLQIFTIFFVVFLFFLSFIIFAHHSSYLKTGDSVRSRLGLNYFSLDQKQYNGLLSAIYNSQNETVPTTTSTTTTTTSTTTPTTTSTTTTMRTTTPTTTTTTGSPRRRLKIVIAVAKNPATAYSGYGECITPSEMSFETSDLIEVWSDETLQVGLQNLFGYQIHVDSRYRFVTDVRRNIENEPKFFLDCQALGDKYFLNAVDRLDSLGIPHIITDVATVHELSDYVLTDYSFNLCCADIA